MVEIIDAVTMARPRRRNIFWDDELASMVKALYVSVLEAVATMVQFLLQKVERVNIVDRGVYMYFPLRPDTVKSPIFCSHMTKTSKQKHNWKLQEARKP